MINITSILALFLVVIVGFFFVFFMTKKMKTEASTKYANLERILGSSTWSVSNTGSQSRSLYIVGTFMGREIRCDYLKTIGGNFLDISCKPNNVPKKTPWYKPISKHPAIYKDYTLSYNTVSIRVFESNLSTEKCTELLEGLNHACEIVERGEY
jgi:hypothetical protein